MTDRPFCVNLVLDFEQDERLEVAVEERVPWVSFSFGLRPELVRRARAGGARVLVQVDSADGARAAAEAGADALIVQGVEAGGHVQSVVGLLPLLAEVRRAVSLPLLAAGGIADPASARAALAAGAAAVVMGTRFVASDECDAHPRYKARLLAAEGRDTVLTELFDVGWPAPHRVLRNTHLRALGGGRLPAVRASARARARRSPAAYRATRCQPAAHGHRGRRRGDGDVRRPGRRRDRRRGAGRSDRRAVRRRAAIRLAPGYAGPVVSPLLALAAAGALGVGVPPAARAVDTSHPDRWVGNGTRAQLYVARGGAGGGQGRHHPVSLRAAPGADRAPRRPPRWSTPAAASCSTVAGA